MTAPDTAIRAVAHGRVQGVGYRQAVVAAARSLGVLGWVRNDDDGTVRVHAEGAPSAIDELAAFLRTGPPGAMVDALQVDAVKVEGHEQFAVRGVSAGRFVVASAGSGAGAGFVLRLEVDGAWRGWALRREPSMVPADKRFAAMVDGDAMVGSGGALWDEGSYEQGGRVGWPEAIERGHAVFVLHGARLRGGFALQRTRGSGPAAPWLLIKRRDEFAV